MLRLLATIAVIVAVLWVISSLAIPEAVPELVGHDITPEDAAFALAPDVLKEKVTKKGERSEKGGEKEDEKKGKKEKGKRGRR